MTLTMNAVFCVPDDVFVRKLWMTMFWVLWFEVVSPLYCFPGKELSNNYSVNTVDLCPVGVDEHRLSFQNEGLVFKRIL